MNWDLVLAEFWFLVKAPVIFPDLWWIVSPLIVITFLMAFYFGRYAREKLGWNGALSNSVVLFFVCVDLLRTIYHYSVPASFVNFVLSPVTLLVILFVLLEAVLLTYSVFMHVLPKGFVFFIASPVPVNVQAYVLAVVVYSRVVPSVYTLLAALMLFVVLYVIVRVLQEFEHLYFGYHFKKKRK